MFTAVARRREAKSLRTMLENIETLTGKTVGQLMLLPDRTKDTGRIEIAWEHADGALGLAHATGLNVVVRDRRRLVVSNHGQHENITLTIPLHVVAVLLADALTELDDELAAGATGVSSLHDALTAGDATPEDEHERETREGDLTEIADRHWAAIRSGPYGAAPTVTPLSDMLATLLLDAAGLDGHTHVGELRIRVVMSGLHDGLAQRPWLVDTARGLTAVETEPAVRTVTVTRTTPEPPEHTERAEHTQPRPAKHPER
jgi:hypothetical protein